jgi:hypothetical protein
VKRSLFAFAALCALPLLVVACGTGSGGTAAGGSAASAGTTAPQKFSVGDKMKASDGRAVIVVSAKHGFDTGNEFEQPKTGNEYVEVVYKLVNGSSKEWTSPTLGLKLIDANGQKYSITYVGNQTNIDSLAATGHADSVIQIYEVPKGLALDAVWQPDFFGDTLYQTSLS